MTISTPNLNELRHDNGPNARGTITPVSEATISAGMQVYSFTGVHLGRVLTVDAGQIVVQRSWRRQLRVSVESVLTVVGRQVVLTRV